MNLTHPLTLGYLASWIVATRHALKPATRHLRSWRVAAILLTLGLASLLAAQRIGSSIDSDGFLHEPFFLIGSGSLLSLAGSALALLLLLRRLFSKGAASDDRRQSI